MPIETVSGSWQIDEIHKGGHPVHNCDRLVAGDSLRELFGIADDHRYAYATLQERRFMTDPFARIAATAMSQVVVADWVPAIVVANGDASVVFFRMTIIAAENDDRYLLLTTAIDTC